MCTYLADLCSREALNLSCVNRRDIRGGAVGPRAVGAPSSPCENATATAAEAQYGPANFGIKGSDRRLSGTS